MTKKHKKQEIIKYDYCLTPIKIYCNRFLFRNKEKYLRCSKKNTTTQTNGKREIIALLVKNKE